MENLMSAEGGGELIESLPEDGIVILNQNSALIQKSKIKNQNDKSKIKIIKCSTNEKTDVWAEDIRVTKDWLYFKAYTKASDSADFKVNLVGKQNIENLLLAAAGAKELGMTLEEIALAAQKIKPEQGAMKLIKKQGFDIIDSTYSANPDGVLAALEHLKLWSGSKVVIMPCLIELGPAAKETHQRIGKKIGQICSLAIITSKDWFAEIKKFALAEGMKPENIIFSENPEEIAKKVKAILSPDSVVLLEGRVPNVLIEKLK